MAGHERRPASRDAILTRLRQAASAGDRWRSSLPSAIPRAHEAGSQGAALVETFVAEARRAGATVQEPLAPEAARQRVVELLNASGVRQVLSWDDLELPVGLGDHLRTAGCAVLDAEVPDAAADRAAWLDRMGTAGAGITGALAGLCDTGSLVLSGGPGRSRLTWLLPPVHVALLSVADLYAGMAAFMAAWQVTALPAHVAFVTGPSRTADIELTLTRGVHGPRDVHIVLVGA